MFIKQISIFVDNQPGKLVEVTDSLSRNGVDISALSLADTSDFGILRLIVNDPDLASNILREQGYIAKQTDVIAAVMDDRPGGLSEVLHLLAENGISIEYMYAFTGTQNGHAVVVLRTSDDPQAVKVLEAGKISTLKAKDIYRI